MKEPWRRRPGSFRYPASNPGGSDGVTQGGETWNFGGGYLTELKLDTHLPPRREAGVQSILGALADNVLLKFSLEGFDAGIVESLLDAAVQQREVKFDWHGVSLVLQPPICSLE